MELSEEDKDVLEQYCEENHCIKSLIEAATDMGYTTVDEITDWLDSGDYTIIFADNSDYDLGAECIAEMGMPQDMWRYFDEDAYRRDLDMEYYSEQEEDESDEDFEAREESEKESYMEEILDQVESGHADQEFLERYFDYEAFGRDLRIGDGYCYYAEDNCWICTY